jgi:uncharacterized membrane protein YuzA (DUF378 family)
MKNLSKLDVTLHMKCYGGRLKGGDFMNKKWIHMVAFVLVIVGGVLWGIEGIFNTDLVEVLFQGLPTVQEIIYVLVGASAVYLAITHTTDCKTCSTK